jgi:hypothetical protein
LAGAQVEFPGYVTKSSYKVLIPFASDDFLHPPNIVDLTEIHLRDHAVLIEESGEAKASKNIVEYWPPSLRIDRDHFQ